MVTSALEFVTWADPLHPHHIIFVLVDFEPISSISSHEIIAENKKQQKMTKNIGSRQTEIILSLHAIGLPDDI